MKVVTPGLFSVVFIVVFAAPAALISASESTADTIRPGISAADADAFVRNTFRYREVSNYDRAVDLYLGLIEAIGRDLSQPDRERIDQHFYELSLILPREILESVCGNERPIQAPGSCEYADDAADILIRWWRSQDPLPGTFTNERVFEHLDRVAYAHEHFASRRAPHGFDDRGKVYIRYGEPDERVNIHPWTDAFFITRVMRDPSLSTADFRRGEFWVYGRVDDAAHYLFVQDRGEHRFGTATEFVPQRLRGRYALEYIDALRVLFRTLSQYHIDYSTLFNEADGYWMTHEMPGSTAMNPRSMAMVMSSQSNEEERLMDRRRERVPEQSSDVLREFEPLGIQIRTARFLEEDGRTRVEYFWSHPPDAFELTRRELDDFRKRFPMEHLEGFAVTATAAVNSSDYDRRAISQHHYSISLENAYSGAPTAVKTLDVTIPHGTFHKGAQWDAYLMFNDAERALKIGPQYRRVTFRIDSTRALDGSGRLLELSDLRPMYPEERGSHDPDDWRPYPFQGISTTIPVALYFEVYHLAFDNDDFARYTVSYDVTRFGRGGLLSRLRGDDGDVVTSEYTVETHARNANEFIQLDLAHWDTDGHVEVIVRVRDEVSGTEVARSLTFDVTREELVGLGEE